MLLQSSALAQCIAPWHAKTDCPVLSVPQPSSLPHLTCLSLVGRGVSGGKAASRRAAATNLMAWRAPKPSIPLLASTHALKDVAVCAYSFSSATRISVRATCTGRQAGVQQKGSNDGKDVVIRHFGKEQGGVWEGYLEDQRALRKGSPVVNR